MIWCISQGWWQQMTERLASVPETTRCWNGHFESAHLPGSHSPQVARMKTESRLPQRRFLVPWTRAARVVMWLDSRISSSDFILFKTACSWFSNSSNCCSKTTTSSIGEVSKARVTVDRTRRRMMVQGIVGSLRIGMRTRSHSLYHPKKGVAQKSKGKRNGFGIREKLTELGACTRLCATSERRCATAGSAEQVDTDGKCRCTFDDIWIWWNDRWGHLNTLNIRSVQGEASCTQFAVCPIRISANSSSSSRETTQPVIIQLHNKNPPTLLRNRIILCLTISLNGLWSRGAAKCAVRSCLSSSRM